MSGICCRPYSRMSGGAYFDQHLASQAWAVAAGDQPRKGEEQGYCERFRHCSMCGC
jgi:hypothetical protein